MRLSSDSGSAAVWLRIATIALVIASLALPVNDLFRYALLLLASVVICTGAISVRPGRWLAALAVVALALIVRVEWPAPKIDEGHNIFIADGPDGALERGLPPGAFRLMKAEFDARYQPECRSDGSGCVRDAGRPARTYGFSADGIFDSAPYSRRVTAVDFSDPVWLRLGVINEVQYNWIGTGGLKRNVREPRGRMLLHPWRLLMPYFVMYRFPADFVGSRLCWKGEVLWEGPDQQYAALRNAETGCRPIESADVSRMIFGVSIAAPLEMNLQTPLSIRLHNLLGPGSALLAAVAILLLLVRWRPRRAVLPLVLMSLALAVVVVLDASFVGGVRPFDGGDDGLFYEGVARHIVQHFVAGDYASALIGDEKVFYYGGPGLRYLRAFEHFVFGESFLGYLSLMLVLPLLVFAAFKRFLGARAALAMALIFVAIPIGALFGTSYFQYVKWASRGFADPAAAAIFLGGLICLVGRDANGPGHRFGEAWSAGALFALALWLRPNLAPAAGILLGGAGLAALWQRQATRVIGLCVGFLPVLGMALHNWYFGGVFVLFSSNATITEALPMPPSAYVAALGEILRFDFSGEHVRRGILQMARWLAGPSESFMMIPLHVAAIIVLVRVAVWGRGSDPWLRLIAAATLAEHPVAWFYLSYDRYYYLAWLLTLLVCVVWMRDEGYALMRRHLPRVAAWIERHPGRARLVRALDCAASISGATPSAARR